MNVKDSDRSQSDDSMCKSCMVFYGSDVYKGFCSACYKYVLWYLRKHQVEKKEEIVSLTKKAESTVVEAICEEAVSELQNKI